MKTKHFHLFVLIVLSFNLTMCEFHDLEDVEPDKSSVGNHWCYYDDVTAMVTVVTTGNWPVKDAVVRLSCGDMAEFGTTNEAGKVTITLGSSDEPLDMAIWDEPRGQSITVWTSATHDDYRQVSISSNSVYFGQVWDAGDDYTRYRASFSWKITMEPK